MGLRETERGQERCGKTEGVGGLGSEKYTEKMSPPRFSFIAFFLYYIYLFFSVIIVVVCFILNRNQL